MKKFIITDSIGQVFGSFDIPEKALDFIESLPHGTYGIYKLTAIAENQISTEYREVE